ncbi:hypothetical protein [Fodinicurvata sediminis]|uniref:hypothetical protein n=1 Tax=Fodinicurvata sediminis TaxID=1121832 RepID=UPI0003B3C3ED|nr:hypothetical protein [Fodinicurvata sediminis]
MQEIIAALISFFLIEPVQAKIAEHYTAEGYSAQEANQVASCFSDATPSILDRAGNNPAWAVGHAVGYWTGTATVSSILADAAPDCVETLDKQQETTTSAL